MGLGPSDVIAGSGDDEKLEPGNRLSSGTEMSSGSFRAPLSASPGLLEQLVPCDDLPLRLERLRSKRATALRTLSAAPVCPASGIPSFHSGFRDVHSSFSGSRDTAALAATAWLRTTPPDLSLAGASRTRSQTWTQTRHCCMRRGNTRGWVAQTLCWDFSPAQMSVSCRPVALATTDGVLKFDKKIVRERSHLFANVNVRDLCREPRVCVRKSLETGLLDRKIGAEDGVHCYLTHAVPVDRRRLQLPEVSQTQLWQSKARRNFRPHHVLRQNAQRSECRLVWAWPAWHEPDFISTAAVHLMRQLRMHATCTKGTSVAQSLPRMSSGSSSEGRRPWPLSVRSPSNA